MTSDSCLFPRASGTRNQRARGATGAARQFHRSQDKGLARPRELPHLGDRCPLSGGDPR